jgi:hypothetical protein
MFFTRHPKTDYVAAVPADDRPIQPVFAWAFFAVLTPANHAGRIATSSSGSSRRHAGSGGFLFQFDGGPGEHPMKHGLPRVGQLDWLPQCEPFKLLLLFG